MEFLKDIKGLKRKMGKALNEATLEIESKSVSPQKGANVPKTVKEEINDKDTDSESDSHEPENEEPHKKVRRKKYIPADFLSLSKIIQENFKTLKEGQSKQILTKNEPDNMQSKQFIHLSVSNLFKSEPQIKIPERLWRYNFNPVVDINKNPISWPRIKEQTCESDVNRENCDLNENCALPIKLEQAQKSDLTKTNLNVILNKTHQQPKVDYPNLKINTRIDYVKKLTENFDKKIVQKITLARRVHESIKEEIRQAVSNQNNFAKSNNTQPIEEVLIKSEPKDPDLDEATNIDNFVAGSSEIVEGIKKRFNNLDLPIMKKIKKEKVEDDSTSNVGDENFKCSTSNVDESERFAGFKNESMSVELGEDEKSHELFQSSDSDEKRVHICQICEQLCYNLYSYYKHMKTHEENK